MISSSIVGIISGGMTLVSRKDRKRPVDTPGNKDRAVDPATKARFEELALPCLDAVYTVARILSGQEAEAKDLVQETFTRALCAFHRFELREHGPKPWLLRILHNVFYSSKTRQRREPTLLDDIDFDHFADELGDFTYEPASVATMNWEGFDQELKCAVMQLGVEYREVLLLWAVEDLRYREIAEICHCPVGTVMSRLYRARQLLTRQLRDYADARGIRSERDSS